MTTTNFIDKQTVIVADWLNDVDAHIYNQDIDPHDQYILKSDLLANNGSSLVQYNEHRTVQDKLGEIVSVKDFGAVGDGVTDDTQAFINCSQMQNVDVVVPPGTYVINQDITVAAEDSAYFISPEADFIGTGLLRFDVHTPFQITPVFVNHGMRKDYGSSYDNYANCLLFSGHVKNSTTDAGKAVVAMYGLGEAAANGARAWGGNLTGVVTQDGGVAIGVEVDAGIRGAATTGKAYGVVVSAAGNATLTAALQVQTNAVTSQWRRGLTFVIDPVHGCITKEAIYFGGTGTMEKFASVDSTIRATVSELDFPSLRVGATPSAVANRILINGRNTGGSPQIVAEGSDANIGLELTTKGTGITRLLAGTSEVFRTSSSAGVDNLEAQAATGSANLNARGTSTNVDLALNPKGTGKVKMGTLTASADAPITGYIEIKDAAGNIRKLAVIG